jgi:hypothetical protein
MFFSPWEFSVSKSARIFIGYAPASELECAAQTAFLRVLLLDFLT